jgi:RNA polymerase-associated protein
MGLIANKRSVMTLFSDPMSIDCHRSRMVLSEKGITHEVVDVTPDNLPEDLIDLNPYQSTPTLVDRELVLYGARVVMEYIDERFPHPPLMPVDPVTRARIRLALYRVENDWFPLARDLDGDSDKKANAARKRLREEVINSHELFDAAPFFLSEELSLADCTLAPVLWRLERWGIAIPGQLKGLHGYMERIFCREGFRNSLSAAEREFYETD